MDELSKLKREIQLAALRLTLSQEEDGDRETVAASAQLDFSYDRFDDALEAYYQHRKSIDEHSR